MRLQLKRGHHCRLRTSAACPLIWIEAVRWEQKASVHRHSSSGMLHALILCTSRSLHAQLLSVLQADLGTWTPDAMCGTHWVGGWMGGWNLFRPEALGLKGRGTLATSGSQPFRQQLV
jgi:hypothetical protein